MHYTYLGRTGLKVSKFCLGTMNFGMVTDEPTSFTIMDAALDSGINFFDTADVYGGPQTPDMAQGFGTSEEIIGNWLSKIQVAGTRSSCPPRCTSRWVWVRTTNICQPITSERPVRTACDASRQIISICIRCTTSITGRLGKKSGRQWNCSFSRAKYFTSAAAISAAGTLPPHRPRPGPELHGSGLGAESV